MASGPASQGFHVLDYIIFIGALVISIGIGLYHALSDGKQRTTKEYLLGDRRLQTLPVALSMLVSFVSAILVLGTPAEMYTRGTQLTMRTLGYCLAVALSSLIFVPLFFPLKITSCFEYLERRYKSKPVMLMGTLMMLFGTVFYMGLVMYTPSTALKAVTGFPLWGSILACGVVSTIYTTLGGLKAVIWTDVFQAFVMIGGMLAIVIQGCIHVGGLSKVWSLSQDGGRLIFFNFDPDPTQRLSFWSLVIGGMFSTLTIFGVGQASVQRYCSLPTMRQAKCSMYLNIPGLLIVNILATLVGLVVYAYYAKIGCDPLKQGYIENANQLVPYFVIDVLNYPGFPGIFLAVLFSGALSSMSSMLNSAAAVTWQDIVRHFVQHISESRKTVITKILVVIYGGLAMSMSFMAEHLGGHVLQVPVIFCAFLSYKMFITGTCTVNLKYCFRAVNLFMLVMVSIDSCCLLGWPERASLSFSGATTGPSMGMFLLGALVPWANAKGATVGCLVSLAFSLWLSIGTFITKPYKRTKLPTSVANCSAGFINGSSIYMSSATFHDSTHINSTIYHFVDMTSIGPQTNTGSHELSGINRLYGISFLWYSAIGCGITMVIGALVSLLTGRENEEVDEELIIPLGRRLCCCLPKRFQHYLWGDSNSENKSQSEDTVEKGDLLNCSSQVPVKAHECEDISTFNISTSKKENCDTIPPEVGERLLNTSERDTPL